MIKSQRIIWNVNLGIMEKSKSTIEVTLLTILYSIIGVVFMMEELTTTELILTCIISFLVSGIVSYVISGYYHNKL